MELDNYKNCTRGIRRIEARKSISVSTGACVQQVQFHSSTVTHEVSSFERNAGL